MSDTITAYGWEMHLTDRSYGTRGHDKFYRVTVVGATTLIHYGRRDGVGCFAVHHYPSQRQAVGKARDMTNEKECKGYVLTRDMTTFEVDETTAQGLRNHVGGRQAGSTECHAVVRAFKAEANTQGTVLKGASR